MSDLPPAPARRGDLIAAMVVFVAVNVILLSMNGVRHGGDSPLYLDGANRVLAGQPMIGREPSYAGYIWIVAAAQSAGLGTAGVVAIQILAGAAAAATVFWIGAALAGRIAGSVAAGLYAVDADTNRWHQFILADSMYVSLFTIGALLTYRAATRRGVEPIITAFVVLVAAALVRPEGWFVIPAAIGYLLLMRARSAVHRLAGAAAIAAGAGMLALVIAPSVQGNLQAVGPANMLQRGQTIWEFDGWRVEMPPAGAGDATSEAGAVGYALQHPISTLKLMAARVIVHFAHVRPFYSSAHNVVIALWLIPLYTAAVYAVWRLGVAPLSIWILAAIATQTIVVALTHAEWDGRYLAHVLPLIDTLAGAGAALLVGHARPTRMAHG